MKKIRNEEIERISDEQYLITQKFEEEAFNPSNF